MESSLQHAGLFLITTVFNLYLMLILLRFFLQWVHADFYNPFAQFITRTTNPILVPLRRVIPGFAGLDMAAVVLVVCLNMLKLFLVHVIAVHTMPHAIGILIWTGGDLLSQILSLFFFAILLQILISFVNQGQANPLARILNQLNEPLIAPIRKIIPVIAGIDISPVPVMLVLQLLTILIAEPIIVSGRHLALLGGLS